MAAIASRLQTDIHAALRAGDKTRVNALRLLLAEVRRRAIDEGKDASAADFAALTAKLVRQREESAVQFRAGNRPELAEKEEAEIAVLRAYLPAPLSAEEIKGLIEDALRQTQAASPRDIGRVMSHLRPQIAARADAAQVAAQVKACLGG